MEFPNHGPAVRLDEGEQAAYEEASGGLTRGAGGKLANSWRTGRLIVENRTLSFVIEELNRKFPGRILIARPSLGERRVSGVIGMTDKDAALSFVTRSLGVRIVQIGPISVLI